MKLKLLNLFMPMVLVFAMSSCSKSSKDEAVVEKTIVTKFDYSPEETQLMQMINDYRISQGMPKFQVINHISHKSLEHNNYMITNNTLTHDLFNERSQNLMDVLGAYKVGENLAYNFSNSTTVLNAWKNSPGHKANLDSDYTHFGLSITVSPTTGKKYYTNMFIKK